MQIVTSEFGPSMLRHRCVRLAVVSVHGGSLKGRSPTLRSGGVAAGSASPPIYRQTGSRNMCRKKRRRNHEKPLPVSFRRAIVFDMHVFSDEWTHCRSAGRAEEMRERDGTQTAMHLCRLRLLHHAVASTTTLCAGCDCCIMPLLPPQPPPPIES